MILLEALLMEQQTREIAEHREKIEEARGESLYQEVLCPLTLRLDPNPNPNLRWSR